MTDTTTGKIVNETESQLTADPTIDSELLPIGIRRMKQARPFTREELDELGIIHPGMQDKNLLNIFRDLRNRIFKKMGNDNFVCLISSMDPAGESSRLAVNLASVIGFDVSKTTLILDCGMDSPLIDSLLPSPARIGIIDFIEKGERDLALIVHQTRIPRMRLVPRGHANDMQAEYYSSNAMRAILGHLKERYPDRYIIVNGPSMLLSSEVHTLANLCDLVILEMHYGISTKADIEAAIEVVGASKLAGIVFKN